MKNLFKFGFLGLALTIGAASCGGSSSTTEQDTADTAVLVEETVETDTSLVITDTTITTDTVNVQ